MVQWSVYFKLLSGVEEFETLVKEIERILPKKGKVEIIHITDKQYEDIVSFYSKSKGTQKKRVSTATTFFKHASISWCRVVVYIFVL